MVFGVLNPEKMPHQLLVHLPTSHVNCRHFTLGNQKNHFSTVLFLHTSDFLCYLRRKQTVTSLPTTPENVTTLPCKKHKFFIFLIVSRVSTEYQSAIRTSCGSVLLWHGLNFNRTWWMMQLISGEKDWKHVFVQKTVTLNICCNVACLTFHLPHITTGSFQSHQMQHTFSQLGYSSQSIVQQWVSDCAITSTDLYCIVHKKCVGFRHRPTDVDKSAYSVGNFVYMILKTEAIECVGLTSHSTHNRSFRGRFLQARWPNQQRQQPGRRSRSRKSSAAKRLSRSQAEF